MFEGVTSLDLSGVTGHIYYNYDSMSQSIPAVLVSLGALIFLILLGGVFLTLVSKSKTRRYREELVDLYVSATIRKFAKDDSLNLDEEYINFLKDQKKKKLSLKSLDEVVEMQLSEKVVEQEEKKLNKTK